MESVLREMGCDPEAVDFESARQFKEAARRNDSTQIALGVASAQEIQRHNSLVLPGQTVSVIDYGRSLD
jgi:hypothetical protein